MKVQNLQNVPLTKFSAENLTWVKRCRELVGFKDDSEWECPYAGKSDAGAHDFPVIDGGITVGCGLALCYPCNVENYWKHNSEVTSSDR